MTATKLHDALDERGVTYEEHSHLRAVSAHRVAAIEHVTGWQLAKPVMLDVAGELAMAVVPAATYVDLGKTSEVLGHNRVRLATEDEFAGRFPDCEVGAEPPFGNLYGIPVFLDLKLRVQPRLVCRDGSHTRTISVAMDDYLRLVSPEVVDISTD